MKTSFLGLVVSLASLAGLVFAGPGMSLSLDH